MKVLVLGHASLKPPEGSVDHEQWYRAPWKTEYDVTRALRKLGHQVHYVGIDNSLQPLERAIDSLSPQIAFNLLEEFDGQSALDQHVVSFLELKGIAYSGCNPRGLTLSRDKAIAKSVVRQAGVLTPEFWVASRRQEFVVPRLAQYPLFVKSLSEDASLGISRSNIVRSPEALKERIRMYHDKFKMDAIVEEFVDGREVYVGVLGNHHCEALPPWELREQVRAGVKRPLVATRKLKWCVPYRRQMGVETGPARLPQAVTGHLQEMAVLAYRALRLNGFARMDFRLSSSGLAYFIEANANPDIGRGDDFAASAESAGWTYERLLQRLLQLGRSWSLKR